MSNLLTLFKQVENGIFEGRIKVMEEKSEEYDNKLKEISTKFDKKVEEITRRFDNFEEKLKELDDKYNKIHESRKKFFFWSRR